MTLRRTLLAAALLALASAAPAAAQTIRGKVIDAASSAAIPEATVAVLDARDRTIARMRTVEDGWFELQVREPGTYRLRVQRIGYTTTTSQPLDLGYREVVTVDMKISNTELALEPLTVTARRQPPRLQALERNGFYDRERQGFGSFLVREDMARAREMSDALRSLPGVRAIPTANNKYQIVMSRAGGQCNPRILIDNVPVPGGQVIDDVIDPMDVEAVEVYRGSAQVPVMWGGSGGGACGVIAIWTRTGEEAR